ncbi:MAG: LTA synthase family protein [Ruminococcus sp.]|nr:LTA synthase family protein [Ruminococcus sp.]
MKEKIISGKDKFVSWVKRVNTKRDLNTEKYRKTNLFLMLFFPFFICSMAEINQGKYVTSYLSFLVERPSVMLFNVIIASLIFCLFLALIKKGWIAILAETIIYMAISTTELFKYGTNGNHLILSDMRLARNVKSLTSFAYIKISPELIIYFAIAALYVFLAFYFNPKIKMRPVKRIVTSVGCIIPCAAMILSPAFSEPIYSIFNINTTAATNTFLLNEKFESNSLLAFLVETASESYENRLVEPDDYSEESINAVLDVNIEGSGDFNDGTKPNVIVIMSESYADFRAFDELDVDDSYYKGFDDAAAEGHSGTLIAPTYASWTVRSEFELLFGLPVRGLQDPNMPQRELAEREQPALAQYYNDWGYETVYIHPFEKTFYSRERVYDTFGFDQMIFHNDEESDFTVPVEYFGTYVDDSTIFNQIEKLVTETDEPMYIHTTTMQNHQPYDQGEDPNDEFNNYLQWIQHTTDGLTTFIDSLKQIDEPTLVFFVGDHFPSLRGETSVYNQLGIDGENCSIIFEQNYFLWSNYDADYSSVPDEDISFFYMPYVLMNIIDAPRDEFIQKMNDYMEEVPVYSTNYDSETPDNEELDMLTYDRVVGKLLSPSPIPEELLNEDSED